MEAFLQYSKSILFTRIAMLVLLVATMALSQQAKKPNIAVLPFTGDKNVTTEQLGFITGEFTSQMVETNAFVVLDRNRVEDILKEQGFQQTGVCSGTDCRVKMGQMLGVDYLISGALVRFGPSFGFRIEYLDVASGQIVKTVSIEQEGELHQIYKRVCMDAATKLAAYVTGTVTATVSVQMPNSASKESSAQEVPKDAIPASQQSSSMPTRRKIALALWGVSLVGAGGGYYFDQQGVDYVNKYRSASALERPALETNVNASATRRNISLSVSVGSLVAGLILWFVPFGG